MTRSASRSLLAVTAIALGACTPFALSPPARTLPLESPATLEEGEVAVQAAGGYHDAVPMRIGSAAVRARIGIVSLLELQLEGTYAHVDYGDERSPHLVAGRAGLKVAPIPHIAFVAGLGVGTHSYGSFSAPDLGLIVGYENPYFVPWTAFRGFVSLPIDANRVVVTQTDSEGAVEEFVLTPPGTAGWQLSTGFRIPIPVASPHEPGVVDRVDLHAGIGLAHLYSLDTDDSLGLYHVELGVEIVLAP